MTIHACSKRVAVHVDQYCKVQDPCWYPYFAQGTFNNYIFMQQQSGCGCGSALQGPRHLLRNIVGYGNVAVNRQQHSYSYLEGSSDWSVSGTVHLLHSSASPSAHRNQPRSSEILINVCTTSALVNDTHACLC